MSVHHLLVTLTCWFSRPLAAAIFVLKNTYLTVLTHHRTLYNVVISSVDCQSSHIYFPASATYLIDGFGSVYIRCIRSVESNLCPMCRGPFSQITRLRIDGIDEPNPDASPSLSRPEPRRHNAFCDLCSSDIYGDRYKCLDCPGKLLMDAFLPIKAIDVPI